MSANYFRSDGHLTDNAAALYVDGMILDKMNDLPDAIVDHVDDCLGCKQTVLELHAVASQQDYTRQGSHPYFDQARRASIPRRWYYAAASILFLVGLMYLYFRGERDPAYEMADNPPVERPVERPYTPPKTEEALKVEDPGTRDLASKAPLEQDPDNKLLAYEPSVVLDELVHLNVRSFAADVISPANNDTLLLPVRFEWAIDLEEKIFLKIMNNMEEERFSGEADNNRFEFREQLAPGLYYWKLETEDDLLYVGRFYVK